MWDFYVRQMEAWKERLRDKTPQSIFSIELIFFEDLFGFQYSIPTVAGENLDTVLYLLASICVSLKEMEPPHPSDNEIAYDYFEGYKQLVINALNKKIGKISRIDLIKSHFRKKENAPEILLTVLKDEEFSAGIPLLLNFLDLEPNLLARIASDCEKQTIHTNPNPHNDFIKKKEQEKKLKFDFDKANTLAKIEHHLKERGMNLQNLVNLIPTRDVAADLITQGKGAEAVEIAKKFYSDATNTGGKDLGNLNALKFLANLEQEKADKPDNRRFITKFFSPIRPDITCRFYYALATKDFKTLADLSRQNPKKAAELRKKEFSTDTHFNEYLRPVNK